MYLQRFGLAREPFSIAPDPRFLFMSERHREALAHLLFGLQGGGGFVVLTGEVGAGKTTVCRCFLEQVPASCNVAYIFNPRLTDTELLKTVCDEFHITVPATGDTAAPSIKHYLDPLNAFLLDAHARGRNNVLVIDEAQNLSPSLLEQLRLLTNLETAERKLLQIILIGQPELRSMLAAPALLPLAQRVIARYHLQALSAGETEAYVRHRLGVAGLAGALPFDAAALRRIHALAQGVPRRINLLCDRALLGAYGGNHAGVDAHIVEQAAREVFDASPARAAAPARRWAWLAAGALGGAAALAAGAWLLGPLAPAGSGALAARGGSASAASGAHSAAAASAASATLVAHGETPVAASAASVAGGAAAMPAVDITTLLDRLPRDERAAWHSLATLWPAPAGPTATGASASGTAVPAAASAAALPDATDPCAAGQPLRCHRAVLTLAQIRQLARPGLLRLQPEGGAPVWALLVGLGEQRAWLRVGGQTQAVSLASLARWWHGDFATLWRVPEGLPDPAAAGGAAALAAWLSARLDTLDAPNTQDTRPLRERIAAFQLAQGLRPDGLPGPMTLMQLNRASGLPEPRLTPEG